LALNVFSTTIGASSGTISAKPIFPRVARASPSQTSLPQFKSYLTALSTLSNNVKLDFSLSIIPIAIYPELFSVNF
jgi:hypothetical protein